MRPLTGPSVWTGAEMAARSDWLWRWEPAEVAELLAIGERARDSGLPLHRLDRDALPLPLCAPKLAAIQRDLEEGSGLVNLRGLPEDAGAERLRGALWAIGLHLGTAVSQSARGELLAEVRDTGERMGEPGSRAYRTGGGLRFHTDRCDVVALLCVHQAPGGGDSLIASTPAIHNRLLETRPDALALLFGEWFHSRVQEHQPGEAPFYRNPIFAIHEGRFTSQFSRGFLDAAQNYLDVPKLTPAQREAVDLLGSTAAELALRTRIEPGDIQLLNNHVTYHGRTELQDPERRRLLYRLWLSMPNSRALPATFAELWGATEAGTLRGGVVARAGYRTAAEIAA